MPSILNTRQRNEAHPSFWYICLPLVLCLALAASGIVPLADVAAQPALASAPAQPEAPAAASIVQYLQFPTVAFLPVNQDQQYENTGRILKPISTNGTFRAAVVLPNFSSLVSLTACFYDNSATKTGTLKLYNAPLDNSDDTTEMASVSSADLADYATGTDTSISPVANNNSVFTYWLTLSVPVSGGPGSDVFFCGASLAYIPPSHPTYNLLSIPGAAFDRPFEDGYNPLFSQSSGFLAHRGTPAGDVPGTYTAPVHLPDGALVTKMTAYYNDSNDTKTLNVYLIRSYLGSNSEMASAASLDGQYKTDDTTISNATIDNYNYTYWAYVYLPSDMMGLWAMTIQYDLPVVEDDWLALSPAAFVPAYEDYDYENHGRWLFHLHSEGGGTQDGVYSAPVQLPQGARIDELWATFYDGSTTVNGSAYLSRARLGVSYAMGDVSPSGSSGYTTGIDPSIANNLVDNSQYNYYVSFVLPVSNVPSPPDTGDVVATRIIIKYTRYYPLFMPVIRK